MKAASVAYGGAMNREPAMITPAKRWMEHLSTSEAVDLVTGYLGDVPAPEMLGDDGRMQILLEQALVATCRGATNDWLRSSSCATASS